MQENEEVNIQMSVQARNLFHTLTMRRAMRIFRFAKRNLCNFYSTDAYNTFYIFYRCIIRHRMKYKTEEKLSCRLCYIREIQNRKYILSDYAIYIGIIPITLGSKEWTEITITITENEIW